MQDRSSIKQKASLSFPSFSIRNFRNFFFVQIVSLTGSWMFTTVLTWLVYDLTNSPFLSGLYTAFGAVPMLLLTPFTAAINRKLSDQKVLKYTQLLLVLTSLAASYLLWINQLHYWQMLIISLVTGAVNAITLPTRQDFIFRLVGRDQLKNGIALNSVAFNTARIIGPAVAGLLIKSSGLPITFGIVSLCFIPIILWLSRLCISDAELAECHEVPEKSKSTFTYINRSPALRKTLMISVVIGMLAMNYGVLTPVLVKQVLKDSGSGYSMLLSFMGIGSLTGALFMTLNSRRTYAMKTLRIITTGISLSLVLIGITGKPSLTAVLYIIYGFFITVFATVSNTFMILNSDDKMRLKVISLYTLLFNGTNPIGGVIVGIIADRTGIIVCQIILGLTVFLLTNVVYASQ